MNCEECSAAQKRNHDALQRQCASIDLPTEAVALRTRCLVLPSGSVAPTKMLLDALAAATTKIIAFVKNMVSVARWIIFCAWCNTEISLYSGLTNYEQIISSLSVPIIQYPRICLLFMREPI